MQTRMLTEGQEGKVARMKEAIVEWKERAAQTDRLLKKGSALNAGLDDTGFEQLKPFRLDVLVMAGYMLIASPAFSRHHVILNLHPALPTGPTGTWQEVIWSLLEREEEETGAMMHLATAELDRGPVVSLFRFPITGGDWDPLWQQFRDKRQTMSTAQIAAAEGEAEPLFAEIRRRGEIREIPLLYQTLRQFTLGQLNTAAGAVFAESSRLPLDLSDLVNEELARR